MSGQKSEIHERNGTDQHAPPEPADGNRLEQLNAALAEKEKLVALLTDQLEEAARRLDRIQREGPGRARGDSAASLHGALAEHLQQALNDWEDLQPAEWLQRIDRQLTDIHELLCEGGSGSDAAGSRPSAPGEQQGDPLESRAWQEMKARILGEEPPSPDRTADDTSPDAEPGFDVDQPADHTASQQPEVPEVPIEFEAVEPPGPVDVDTADRETLRAAVEERDQYITYLIGRLRVLPALRPQPVDWEALNNAPADLRTRLEDLETRLSELMRLEECDMSLERAKLARERSRLEHLQASLERSATSARRKAQLAQPPEEQEEVDDRRWLRVFGVKKNQRGDQ